MPDAAEPIVRHRERRSRIAVYDTLAVVWIVASLLLGVLVHREVRGLIGLTTTVERVGGQLSDVGKTFSGIKLPLVGNQLGDAGAQAQANGALARQQARKARTSVKHLSWLLAIAVVVLAIAPLLATYLPLRIGWARDGSSLARLVARARDDPALARLLSQRAIITMRDRELDELPDRPWDARPAPVPGRSD